MPKAKSRSPACAEGYAASLSGSPLPLRGDGRGRGGKRLSTSIVKVYFFVQPQGRIRCILEGEEEGGKKKRKKSNPSADCPFKPFQSQARR